MSNKKEIATHQALVAILYVAKEQGTDIEKLCEMVKSGLLDSGNLYRYTSADYVTLAGEAIDEAFNFVNGQWQARS
ncbi:hypothetical protein [Rivihabitans pingtungensis]|uniref:hypothetical protein n=1 Tax=Rivihabitans pingtungensis TaxID=1054498 RepID=UPI002355D3FF|nr:hypothetical protein [Rivihabitans pingtungensis]MCK6437595.1 hypothetical protein [Rivihabitans pingtungensis]